MIRDVTTRDADFFDLKELERVQSKNWREQCRYVEANSAFYQRHLIGHPPFRGELAEISTLPLTDKETLREDQHRHPPFGSYLACKPNQINRMHRTSGTSGTAMNLALTGQDALMTAIVGGRAQRASGLGPDHRVVHCLNYQLWMGGYTDHAALEATGAMVVPYGVGGTHRLIETILELGIDAISCTPSYPGVLQQVIQQEFPDLSPRDLGLKLGLFGGEAGLDDSAFRKRLTEVWGFEVRNSNYGVTDVLCNFAGQSTVCNDLHFVGLDVLYPELIDPETAALRPWKEGESGELVLTHLVKQAQPLVRFRTNDIVTLTGTGKAACGRTAPRFRVIGRSDDMIVVRGINVFPTMLTGIVNTVDYFSGEYQIELKHPPPYHYLPIKIELAREMEGQSELEISIEKQIKQQLGVSAKVNLLPPMSLPRTEGKTRLIVRTF